MTRLIDADALIEKLESNAWNIDEWELPHDQVSAGLEANAMDRKTVEEMPTIDVHSCDGCRYELFGNHRCYSCARNFADRIVRDNNDKVD